MITGKITTQQRALCWVSVVCDMQDTHHIELPGPKMKISESTTGKKTSSVHIYCFASHFSGARHFSHFRTVKKTSADISFSYIPAWKFKYRHINAINMYRLCLHTYILLGAFFWNTGWYFLRVLTAFDEPLGESNTERQVKISASISKEGT